MLVSLKELMEDAEKGGYAVGAFNVSNLESLMAIMQAAEETGRGVILNYAEVHAPFLSMEQAALIMLDAAKRQGAGVRASGSRILYGILYPGDPAGIYLRHAGCIGGGL